jgi:cytochrome c
MTARSTPAMRWCRALALTLSASTCAAAHASAQMASDYGCFNCHGNPPRKNAPTFAELARRYSEHRNDAPKQQQLADKLREGTIFSHINAHERLSPETAAALVRWLCDGAP